MAVLALMPEKWATGNKARKLVRKFEYVLLFFVCPCYADYLLIFEGLDVYI